MRLSDGMGENMKRGFTLIELLVVIGMIAILMGAATTSVMKARRRAQIARASTECREITNAILAYENWSKNHSLKDVAGRFDGWTPATDVKQLDFILGEMDHAGGPNGKVPVLYNGAVVGGALLDPWGKPYEIQIKKRGSAQAKKDDLGNGLKTFVFLPNRNRPLANER